MEEAEALSDRIAIMKDGRLLLCDTPAQILAQTGESNIEKAFLKVVKGEMG
jgi:ABC-type Na+ transport system ATPase subunit NatA